MNDWYDFQGGKMVDAWVPLSKLAVLADVSEPTTRRYVASKALSKFFRVRKEARLTLVHVDGVPILKRAYLLSCQGKKMEEIETIIPQEFSIVFDSEPSAPPPQAPAHQQMDLESLAPALTALIPLAERFLVAYERQTKALEAIARALAPNSPYKRTDQQREGKGHPDHQTSQEGAEMKSVDRQAVITRVLDLHAQGLGQYAITTKVRREGLRLSARGQLSKSTVARIIKGKVK